jgi:putative ABC transport system ATP-binding protein
MLELSDVRKVFNQEKPNEFTAIDGISLRIECHQVTVFKGPSGSGKTTLLSLLGCMTRPTSGRIHLMGREITSLPERFLTETRRRTFGFIFQQFNLVKGITALENVMLPAYPCGERISVLKTKAMNLLDLFNVSQKAQSRVEWLSGGEAQRVAIARALINDPAVVIADEPTAHLDSARSQEFVEMVRRLKDDRKTVLIASHDPIICVADSVDRVIHLRDGKLDADANRHPFYALPEFAVLPFIPAKA